MLMKSHTYPKPLVAFVTAATLSMLVFAGSRTANAQSVTIDFRFDGKSGAAATTQSLAAGSAGQSFTVDVWATVFGDAAHADSSQYGLQTVRFRGFSDIASGGGAFATGAGIGVTGAAPFNPPAGDPFNGSANSGTQVKDVGTTTGNGAVVNPVVLDGIVDFGSATTNSLQDIIIAKTSPVMAGTAGAFGSVNGAGYQFLVSQFVFHTGTALTTAGATTQFYVVKSTNGTNASIIQNGDSSGNTNTNLGAAGITIGSPLTFTIAQAAGTTVTVTPGPNASVLKGGVVGLSATINNTGSTALAAGDYNFAASGGTNIGYTAMPSVPIPAPGSASFSTTATTTPGPAGTPIGLATVTFTATGNGGAISNSPQSGTLSLNVGGATADNTNTAGIYGPALTAPVGPGGGSYAGLESAVVAVQGTGGSNASNNASPYLGGHATILAGVNAGGLGRTVSMAWRTRLVPSESPGTRPPLPVGTTTSLSSDVLNLTGLETVGNSTDPYVLDMSYNPTFLPKGGTPATEQSLANNKLIYMVSPTAADGSPYVNTVLLNTANQVGPADPRFGFQGSYSAFVAAFGPGLAPNMGAWGVDIGSHEVWAVLDHNSTFAVIPEPSSILLAGLGLLGLVGLRRRINKVA
jgi:hypothetical protein